MRDSRVVSSAARDVSVLVDHPDGIAAWTAHATDNVPPAAAVFNFSLLLEVGASGQDPRDLDYRNVAQLFPKTLKPVSFGGTNQNPASRGNAYDGIGISAGYWNY